MPTIKDKLKSVLSALKRKEPPVPERIKKMKAVAEAAKRASPKA